MPMPPLPLGDWVNDPNLNAQYKKIVDLYLAGKYDEALPMADDFLSSITARFREDSSSYAVAISVLARLYQAQGRFKEAEDYVKRALAIDERDYPPDHPNIAGDFSALGQLYQAEGRLDEAEPLLKRALAINENASESDPADVGRALNNLAWLYQEQGRYAEAEPLVTRSLLLIEKALGPGDEDYGRALDTLAKLYEGQGRVNDAELLYRRAIAILEAKRGTDYAGVAVSRQNLGGLLKSMGRLDEAEPLLKQALATKEKVFGPQHPNIANLLSQLGDLYRLQGKADEADRLFRRALAIRKATVREIPVYFATDRRQDKNAKTITFSGDSTDTTLTYGQATVMIAKPEATPGRTLSNARLPNAERAGEAQNIETTEVARLAIRSIVVSDERQLMDAAQKQLDAASVFPKVFPKQVFVFVHGFNVSFENALRRTAQIAYDLNFDGAPFLFSWPGGDGLLSYLHVNADSAKIATDHLMEFLEKIVAETHATKIHLIAHSMGNSVLLDALDKLKLKSGTQSPLRFAEIIMHSPDVGSGRFAQVMTAIKGLGSGATLYSSTQDRALGLSAWLSGEKAGATASVFAGVETIDVTAAGSSFLGLNHDIYVTNPAIFNDMRLVLELGRHPPDKRSPASFQPKAAEGGTYWLYRRPEASDASVDAIALPAVAPRFTVEPPLTAPLAPLAVSPAPVVVNPVAAPQEQPPQDEPKAVEAPAIAPAAVMPSSPAVAPPPSPASEPAPQAPPQAAPAPGANGTTASIANAPKATFKRKKRKSDFDPEWNTKPLH
jgi:esterase/lipase superfamily enzyme